MLRRQPSMAFAPGAFVFPGGSVDARDAEIEVGWAGPDAQEWGRMIDAPADLARALVCAAVRETFEECGVLLAGPTADTVVADTRGEDWEADRAALLARSVSLAGLLRRRGLVLRSDLLRPWARWITPVTEERRYDTRFFAAALPAGQRARDVSGEADDAAWVEPAAALCGGPPEGDRLAAADRRHPRRAGQLRSPVRRAHRPAADHRADPRGLHGRRGRLADRPGRDGVPALTSSPPWKGEDSSRDLRSRCRFAVHSRALVRKKAPRAATACPAAVRYWVLRDACLAIADIRRLAHYIDTKFDTYRIRSVPGLKAGAPARRYW